MEKDKLATRLGLILTKFNEGETLTIEALAKEFSVVTRTIQRDFERLKYLPIERNGKEYKLAAYALGKLSYRDIEQFATFSGIQSLYPELNHSLIVDILNQKINKTIEVRGYTYEDLSTKVELFNTIAVEILNHQYLTFEYKEKSRYVAPYKLINTNGLWYLVGVEKDIIKHFALTKILHMKSSATTFIPDRSVLEKLQEHRGVWVTQTHIEIVVKVDSPVKEYFLRRDLLPEQKVLEEREDGLILSAKVSYEGEILRTVRYWIPHLHILSPLSLQQNLEAELRGYLEYSLEK